MSLFFSISTKFLSCSANVGARNQTWSSGGTGSELICYSKVTFASEKKKFVLKKPIVRQTWRYRPEILLP